MQTRAVASELLSAAGAAETACAALGVVERIDELGIAHDHRINADLGNAVAGFVSESVVTEIHEDDADLAAIVGVDGTGGVEHEDSLFQREAAARADLHLEAFVDCDREAGADETAGFGWDGATFERVDIETAGASGGADGQFCGGVETFDFKIHGWGGGFLCGKCRLLF